MEQVQNGTQNKAKSILRKLERYLSINKRTKSSTTTTTKTFTKSRSWNSSSSTAKASAARSKRPPTPNGCFSVHVGPEKQRFVIRTEFANHPLFKMLLEDAEIEYGFKNEGPLLLPCDVDLFCKVLAEMDSGDDEFDQYSCGGYGSCSPFNSGRRLGKSRSAKGYRSYGLLTPPRLLKINNF